MQVIQMLQAPREADKARRVDSRDDLKILLGDNPEAFVIWLIATRTSRICYCGRGNISIT
jgi:hypothetical protein